MILYKAKLHVLSLRMHSLSLLNMYCVYITAEMSIDGETQAPAHRFD